LLQPIRAREATAPAIKIRFFMVSPLM